MEYLFWRSKNPTVYSDLKPPLTQGLLLCRVPQIFLALFILKRLLECGNNEKHCSYISTKLLYRFVLYYIVYAGRIVKVLKEGQVAR